MASRWFRISSPSSAIPATLLATGSVLPNRPRFSACDSHATIDDPLGRCLTRIATACFAVLAIGLWGSTPTVAAERNFANVAPTRVDVALVLAVDASTSMDDAERKMQREGYASALTSRRVLDAIKFGQSGRIAVTYFEWGSRDAQVLIAPWTIIDSPEAAASLSKRIAEAPVHDLQRTSISAALAYAGELLAQSGLTAVREVIDVSGDGPNNDGIVVSEARDALVKRGVTINGLPIVTKSAEDWLSIPDLDAYYDHCVIGGDGSFMIPVRGMENFGKALEMKLVLEIAGIMVDQPKVIPEADRFALSCKLYD